MKPLLLLSLILLFNCREPAERPRVFSITRINVKGLSAIVNKYVSEGIGWYGIDSEGAISPLRVETEGTFLESDLFTFEAVVIPETPYFVFFSRELSQYYMVDKGTGAVYRTVGSAKDYQWCSADACYFPTRTGLGETTDFLSEIAPSREVYLGSPVKNLVVDVSGLIVFSDYDSLYAWRRGTGGGRIAGAPDHLWVGRDGIARTMDVQGEISKVSFEGLLPERPSPVQSADFKLLRFREPARYFSVELEEAKCVFLISELETPSSTTEVEIGFTSRWTSIPVSEWSVVRSDHYIYALARSGSYYLVQIDPGNLSSQRTQLFIDASIGLIGSLSDELLVFRSEGRVGILRTNGEISFLFEGDRSDDPIML